MSLHVASLLPNTVKKHESLLSLSTLKWPFTSLMLYYLQVQFFLKYTYLKYTASAHSIKIKHTYFLQGVVWLYH